MKEIGLDILCSIKEVPVDILCSADTLCLDTTIHCPAGAPVVKSTSRLNVLWGLTAWSDWAYISW